MLMLERIRPGVPLGVCSDDEENTRIAARLMKKFWQPVPKVHSFRPTAYEIDGFDRLRKKYNGEYRATARKMGCARRNTLR